MDFWDMPPNRDEPPKSVSYLLKFFWTFCCTAQIQPVSKRPRGRPNVDLTLILTLQTNPHGTLETLETLDDNLLANWHINVPQGTTELAIRNGHTKNWFAARSRRLHTTDLNIRMKNSRQGASPKLCFYFLAFLKKETDKWPNKIGSPHLWMSLVESSNTVCLGSTNDFFPIFIFMPTLECYWKVWVKALYCPKMSL